MSYLITEGQMNPSICLCSSYVLNVLNLFYFVKKETC